MDCIQTENKAVDLFGAGKHGFIAGNPGAGLLATMLSPAWCNGVQEEILNVVRDAGLVPSGVDYTQLLQAIRIMVGLRTGGVGEVKTFYDTAAPAGWLKANGQTIGSAASGATARANADTLALFTHLWTKSSNAVLPIQDSTGAPSVRGASAAADFAANKRMPLPDMRGEFLRGLDDGRGVDPGRALGSWQDGANASHNHTAASGLAGAHAHGGTTSTDGAHTHSFTKTQSATQSANAGANVGSDGSEGLVTSTDTVTTSSNGSHAHTITGAADHTHSVTVDAAGGPESRPRNIAVLVCISY